MLKFNHEQIQDFIDDLNRLIIDLEDDRDKLIELKEKLQGVASSSAISQYGEYSLDIADYNNTIEFYEAIKNDLENFLEEVDSNANFTRNPNFLYDEEMVDTIEELITITKDLNRDATINTSDNEHMLYGSLSLMNVFHQGSDEEELTDLNNLTLENFALEINDEFRKLTNSAKEIKRLHHIYFSNINIEDIKREHDSYDGIAEHSRQWHRVGNLIAGIGGVSSALNQYIASTKLSPIEVEKILGESMHNLDADTLVLGKYSADEISYLDIAKKDKATYFNIPEDTYDEIKELSDKQIWKVNKKAIDDAIKDGKEIKLTHDPDKYKNDNDSYYEKELIYLEEEYEYEFIPDGKGGWYARPTK